MPWRLRLTDMLGRTCGAALCEQANCQVRPDCAEYGQDQNRDNDALHCAACQTNGERVGHACDEQQDTCGQEIAYVPVHLIGEVHCDERDQQKRQGPQRSPAG